MGKRADFPVMMTKTTATASCGPLCWAQAVIALVFIAEVPYAKPLQILTSFANVVTWDAQAGTWLPGVLEYASP